MKEPVKPVTRHPAQPVTNQSRTVQPQPATTKRPAPDLTTARTASVRPDPTKTVMKVEPAAAPRPEKAAPVESANDISDPQKRHEAQLKGDR